MNRDSNEPSQSQNQAFNRWRTRQDLMAFLRIGRTGETPNLAYNLSKVDLEKLLRVSPLREYLETFDPITQDTDNTTPDADAFVPPDAIDSSPGSAVGDRSASANATIPTLVLSPSAAVPNQTITVIGQGFTTGGSAGINNGVDTSSVLIDGDSTGLKAAGVTSATSKIADGGSILINDEGNWVATVVIPINTTTVKPGTYDLKITDNRGAVGTSTLEIVPRTIEVNPVESKVGTVVTVIGRGFPADNIDTGAASTPSVALKYSYGTTTDTVATLVPDEFGNIEGKFTVPLNAPIPSPNVVQAEFLFTPTGGVEAKVVAESHHLVPMPTVTVDPPGGQSGRPVIIVGEGFHSFSTVSELRIGGIDVRPSPVPSTDEDGGFTALAVVPSLEFGPQRVIAQVSDVPGFGTFNVSP